MGRTDCFPLQRPFLCTSSKICLKIFCQISYFILDYVHFKKKKKRKKQAISFTNSPNKYHFFLSLFCMNILNKHQFNLVMQLCSTLCDPMDWSMPGFLVQHQHPEVAQTHVHQVDDVIQPSHPLSSPSPPASFSLSQHQGLFQWVSSSHQVAKVLELQHQSFQWIFRTDFL